MRAAKICNVTEKYHCLLDDNYKMFKEFCKDSYNFEKSGYKLIVLGSLQREICHTNRYQPIQFRSYGSSECIFSKSNCYEEGQLIFNNGTNVGDRACRCDFTKGYDFVNALQNRCFSIPSEEDCSCYLKQCNDEQSLTPDYRCVNTSEWKPPFGCSINTFFQPPAKTSPYQEQISFTITTTHNVRGLHNYRLGCASALCAVILIFAAIGIIVLVLEPYLIKKEYMKDIHTPADTWRKKLVYFITTKASEDIFNEVKLHQCTLITGPPGCGKTAIAYHIAFELQNTEGYSVETVAMPGEIFKLDSSIYNRRCVFIIDDVIGKNTICNYNVKTIRKAIEDALEKYSRLKIIMTCRSHNYYMNDFGNFFHHSDMLLNTMQLCINERRTMIKRYLGEDFKLQIDDNVLTLYNFFPSLCEMAVKEKEDLLTFLTYPFTFLNNEISTYLANSDVLYLALAVIVVANNNIEESVIKDESINIMLQDIYKESRFEQLPNKDLLYNTLQFLKGTFLLETTGSFSLLSDKLFHTISSVVGKSFIRSIINHGNSNFISHRMQLASLNESCDQFTILVPPHLEDLYFARILRDIQNCTFRDSLRNRQMNVPGYRTKLYNFLKKNENVINRARDKEDGSSVLHIIACFGYVDLLSSFTEKNRPNVKNDKKSSIVLNDACSHPNSNMVKLPLFCEAKLNSQDYKGRTPLHVACNQGKCYIAKILIDNCAQINKTDNNGSTPLHLATTAGHDLSVKLLLENTADINCEDQTGRTAFMIACEKHYEKIINMLLDQYKISKNYLSSLKKMYLKGNENVVKELVKRSQHVNIRFSDGSTPLHIVCAQNDANIVKILLESGVEINIENKKGMTPLYQSCSEGCLEIVELLLKYSANANCTDKKLKTPLHVVCEQNKNDIALVLMKSNANVNARDKCGRTPLFVSCINGNMNLIKCILDNRADVNIRDKNSMLASKVALEKGFPDVTKLLQEMETMT